MSDQWVDQQGVMRNSSGRYPIGVRSPASIESERDSKAFEIAKHFKFVSSIQDAWSTSCRPKLAAILVNQQLTGGDLCGYGEGTHTYVGIEIAHAHALRDQLNRAIADYEHIREKMKTDPQATSQMLCEKAGITLGPPGSENFITELLPELMASGTS